MTGRKKGVQTIIDFITGKEIPLTGAEENRQAVERLLVAEKGYLKQDVIVDENLSFHVTGEEYRSQVDLVVCIENTRFMVIKCAAGSLGSREREALAAARLLDVVQIPYSVVSDGKTAIVMDTISGRKIGEGLEAIWSKEDASEILPGLERTVFPEERLERERLIFRTYDSMNVNVIRNISQE